MLVQSFDDVGYYLFKDTDMFLAYHRRYRPRTPAPPHPRPCPQRRGRGRDYV